MKSIVTTLFIVLLFIVLSCCPLCAGGTLDLVILHTNDFHGSLLPMSDARLAAPPGKVGGAASMAGKIKDLRDRNPGPVLLVDSGDCSMGTALSNAFYGIPVIDYMNLTGFEAMALGNHEFEWGVGKLMAMKERAIFPFLAANLIDRRTGKVPPYAQPYAVIEKGGDKIGLIGLITENTSILQNPHRIRNLIFLPPEEPTRKAIRELRQKGVRIIIVLSHLGLEGDRSLALHVSGIACIIGGHSHTILQKPQKVGETLIVQTGSHGRYLGELKLTLERDSGSVIRYAGKLHPIIDSDITADMTIEAMLMPYQEKIKASLDEVLGIAEDNLLNIPMEGSDSTPLGNFITDALRITCKADVALYKSEGIRADILKGPVRKGDLHQVLPFDNKVMKAELTGKEIRTFIEFAVESNSLAQVSGLMVTYHGDRNRGERIEAILADGVPLADDRSYCLAAIDYLFFEHGKSGGFDVLKKKHRSEVLSRDIVTRFITKQKRIAPSSECRVRRMPGAAPSSK